MNFFIKITNPRNLNPVAAGVICSFFLALTYFLVLAIITKDWSHPLAQFLLYKYWMSALILGFGLQAGLLQFIRSGRHLAGNQAKATVVSSAGISGTTMIACCLHHGLEILPFLGFSAASLFAAKYQTQILAFGVLANLVGISLMIFMIKKRSCELSPFRFKSATK